MNELKLDELEMIVGGTSDECTDLYAAIRRNPKLMKIYKSYQNANYDLKKAVMMTVKSALNLPVFVKDGNEKNIYCFVEMSHQQVMIQLAKY